MDQNLASLIELLKESQRREEELQQKFDQMQSEMQTKFDQMQSEMQVKIDTLIQQLAWFQNKMFGKMSERYKNLNMGPSLFDQLPEFSNIQATEAPIAESLPDEIKSSAKTKRKAHARKDIMDGLPVVRLSPIEPEGIDLSLYKKIGEEVTRKIEFEPGKLYVVETIRPKYVLLDDLDKVTQNVVIAPMPLFPIHKSMAGSSMLTEILIGKYAYHLPFYRQVQQFKDLGVKLSTSTLNDWFIGASEALTPLYERIRQEVLSSDYIQADESIIPVMNKEKSKAVKEYIWMARSVKEKLLFFDYYEGSRSQATAQKVLKDIKGYLQTDDYDGYDVFNKYIDIKRVACWAHVRRKYHDSLKQNKDLAEYALNLIQDLYAVERHCVDKNLNEKEIVELRQKVSKPIILNIKEWIERTYPTVLPGTRIGLAMAYNYKILERLMVYLDNGYLLIDNNLAENAICPLAISRKVTLANPPYFRCRPNT